jgi:hypothetical protein
MQKIYRKTIAALPHKPQNRDNRNNGVPLDGAILSPPDEDGAAQEQSRSISHPSSRG